MTRHAITARVTGRVQGVWFRGWTEETAHDLGLDGWVRNEHDGSVLALIAGSPAAIERMLDLLWEGPSAAQVTGVETGPAEDPGETGFSIQR